jgi:tetratricopeptide (TPR) repeat protein
MLQTIRSAKREREPLSSTRPLIARSNEETQEVVMNVRLVVSPILTLLLSIYVSGQQVLPSGDVIGPPANTAAIAGGEYKQDLLHRVALEEAAVRQAEDAHASSVTLSRTYVQLGLLYQDVARWERSERALDHAVSLLRSLGPTDDLAAALGHLGSLHVEMGKLRDSENEELEALKIRLELGDRLQIARSQSDLATLYLVKQKYVKARDLARLALAEFDTNEQAGALDKISIRFALSEALCSLKDCPSAIPVLKVAMDEAKATLRPDDFPVGLSEFLLGYAYWKSGKMVEASEYLERGTTLMSVQLGWGHPAYLRALRCYAKFLHDSQNVEAANIVERRIRQAESVIDVHSMQTSQGMTGFAGVR